MSKSHREFYKYDQEFYKAQQAHATLSAEIIVPIFISVFPVKSVVDVGCGVGTWLRAFSRNGVTDYLGIDGEHVPLGLLNIPKDRFRAADLRSLSTAGRRFDAACSLEVAEHLPADCASRFVELLTTAAPVVLFSAAIPRQGGAEHINTQWQIYWHALFARHGYVAVDFIRPIIYGNADVAWWYRQNILVYCEPHLRPLQYAEVTKPYELNRVDPAMIEHLTGPPPGIKQCVKAISRDFVALNVQLWERIRQRKQV
jgi:hypothetical protein